MTTKEFQKLVKWCKKQGLSYAKMDGFEFSMIQRVETPKKKGNGAPKVKGSGVEGLVHDPSAQMPSDSEMVFYSTDEFDRIQAGRKETKARNEV